MTRSNRKREFAERISWPLTLWLFIAVMIGSIYLTFWAPFNSLTASIISSIIFIALIYAQYKSRLEIVVVNNWLYADRAKIELKYIKSAKALNRSEFIKLQGVNADPAAFCATRFWVKEGVVVKLNDKKDPTPYWLISSRKAKKLAACLN